ncbi:hypothetical protein SAY87_019812 [Trapa incisa]|uniref:Diphthamide biosynthesis protein 3 n=2 Tax=Trapa TaxID=22665 RepID=A0AAN7LVQ5_TRANT|nr:hypothetical protein SAY87_019812 [Trapa incisa]KAK4792029.1 hypothetical protein SAY86_022464 [Trapa natans]
MEWKEELQAYTYPCPCGDLYQITQEDHRLGEEIARCPSCSLFITVSTTSKTSRMALIGARACSPPSGRQSPSLEFPGCVRQLTLVVLRSPTGLKDYDRVN